MHNRKPGAVSPASQRCSEVVPGTTDPKQCLRRYVAAQTDQECKPDTSVSVVENVNSLETEATAAVCIPMVDVGLGTVVEPCVSVKYSGEPVSCTVSEPDTCVSGEQKISQVEIESVVAACHPMMGAGLGAAVEARGTSGGDSVCCTSEPSGVVLVGGDIQQQANLLRLAPMTFQHAVDSCDCGVMAAADRAECALTLAVE